MLANYASQYVSYENVTLAFRFIQRYNQSETNILIDTISVAQRQS